MNTPHTPSEPPSPGLILVNCHFAQTLLWMPPERPSRRAERRPCNDGACRHQDCPLYDNPPTV